MFYQKYCEWRFGSAKNPAPASFIDTINDVTGIIEAKH